MSWFFRFMLNIINKNFKKTIPILLYHRIDTVKSDPVMLVVSPKIFEEHIKFLNNFYKPISLNELARRKKENSIQGNEICITFDDGYRDNLKNALPILEKYNTPATIFVTTSQLGEKASFDWDNEYPEEDRAYFLSKKEILFLSNNPLIEIGGHTHSHVRLSDLPKEKQLTEIKTNKEILEKITQKKILHFAYPFGGKRDFNKKTIKIVKNLQFIAAYENTGLLATNSSNTLFYPRINIRECTIIELAKQLYT